MTNTLKNISVFTLGMLMAVGVSYVYAWTGPSTVPPPDLSSVNAPAPINVSSGDQYKAGALGVGGVLRAYSSALFGGIDTDVVSTGGEQNLVLDIEGAVGATAYCDEDGNNCVSDLTSLGGGGGGSNVVAGCSFGCGNARQIFGYGAPGECWGGASTVVDNSGTETCPAGSTLVETGTIQCENWSCNSSDCITMINGSDGFQCIDESGDVVGSDTLAGLECDTDDIAKWNGSAWVCADDTDTTNTSTPVPGSIVAGCSAECEYDPAPCWGGAVSDRYQSSCPAGSVRFYTGKADDQFCSADGSLDWPAFICIKQ